MKLGLLGFPIAHSLSPAIHRHWLRTAGIDGTYDRFPLPPDTDGPRLLQLFDDAQLDGCNLTTPFKERVLPWLGSMDDDARQTGAVNTLVRTRAGIRGMNTDLEGFIRAADDARIAPGGTWVLLGAGGAARAAAHGLAARGAASVQILNRTRGRARELTAMLADTHPKLDWTHGPLESLTACRPDGVVNALTRPGIDAIRPHLLDMPTPPQWFDLNYWAAGEPWLAELAGRGSRVATGRTMLVHQAALAFEAWTGTCPSVPEGLAALPSG